MGVFDSLKHEYVPHKSLTPLERATELEQNDEDNARRILSAFGEDIIFVTGKGWGVWDGYRYSFRSSAVNVRKIGHKLRQLVLEEAEALRAAPVDDLTAERVRQDYMNKRPPKVLDIDAAKRIHARALAVPLEKHATKCGNVDKVASALKACEHEVLVDVEDLDADPWALVVQNGQVDLGAASRGAGAAIEDRRTWLGEVQRSAHPTKCAGVPFDPGADCPAWRAFVELIVPDAQVRACLQRACGMLLLGRNDAQVALMFRGSGGNGKSTFVKALQHVLGTRDGYAAPCKIEMFLVTQNQASSQASPDEVDLPGVRAYIASEPAATDELSAKKIKALTGGDPRPVRGLHRDQFVYVPNGTPILSFNRTPKIKDEDEGTRRRLVFFPFDVNLRALPADRQRKPSEVDAELRAEGPGILNWLLEGLAGYCDQGINPPAVMADLKANLMESSDPVGAFLEDCCDQTAGAKLNVTEFQKVYVEWCAATSSQEYRPRTVSDIMTEKGIQKSRSTGGKWFWFGLAWKAGADMDDLLSRSGLSRPATAPAPPDGDIPF